MGAPNGSGGGCRQTVVTGVNFGAQTVTTRDIVWDAQGHMWTEAKPWSGGFRPLRWSGLQEPSEFVECPLKLPNQIGPFLLKPGKLN
jgi:hypothetical protein